LTELTGNLNFTFTINPIVYKQLLNAQLKALAQGDQDEPKKKEEIGGETLEKEYLSMALISDEGF
jgi:hypothetical protein